MLGPIRSYLLFIAVLQLDTRRILKRLAKENLKQLGRMVAKLAHANPMTVLRTIVHQVLFLLHNALFISFLKNIDFLFLTKQNVLFLWDSVMQIEAYRDMITPVVDAFKYLTQVCTLWCILVYWFV